MPEDVSGVSGECFHLDDGVIVTTARGTQREHGVEGKFRVSSEHLDYKVTEILRLFPLLEAVEVQ